MVFGVEILYKDAQVSRQTRKGYGGMQANGWHGVFGQDPLQAPTAAAPYLQEKDMGVVVLCYQQHSINSSAYAFELVPASKHARTATRGREQHCLLLACRHCKHWPMPEI